VLNFRILRQFMRQLDQPLQYFDLILEYCDS
jgi:hypothetical protein